MEEREVYGNLLSFKEYVIKMLKKENVPVTQLVHSLTMNAKSFHSKLENPTDFKVKQLIIIAESLNLNFDDFISEYLKFIKYSNK